MLANIVLILGAYLFGSLPFTVALGKANGLDSSQEKDLHQALWRKVGILEGLTGVFVDFSKGAIPVLIGFGFGLPLGVVAASSVVAVAGQMWPIFCHFDGEKGNTTGSAMVVILALAYRAYPVFLFLIPIFIGISMRFFFSMFSSKEAIGERIKFRETTHPVALGLPVGMILGFAAAPLASWLFGQPVEITLCLLALFLIILVRRLTAGLRADLKTSTNIARVLFNRFLFDCSSLQRE
jgi:glycerol-3-phosphate acyltransferase PlsY